MNEWKKDKDKAKLIKAIFRLDRDYSVYDRHYLECSSGLSYKQHTLSLILDAAQKHFYFSFC